MLYPQAHEDALRQAENLLRAATADKAMGQAVIDALMSHGDKRPDQYYGLRMIGAALKEARGLAKVKAINEVAEALTMLALKDELAKMDDIDAPSPIREAFQSLNPKMEPWATIQASVLAYLKACEPYYVVNEEM